jgi:hypothetical protein
VPTSTLSSPRHSPPGKADASVISDRIYLLTLGVAVIGGAVAAPLEIKAFGHEV